MDWARYERRRSLGARDGLARTLKKNDVDVEDTKRVVTTHFAAGRRRSGGLLHGRVKQGRRGEERGQGLLVDDDGAERPILPQRREGLRAIYDADDAGLHGVVDAVVASPLDRDAQRRLRGPSAERDDRANGPELTNAAYHCGTHESWSATRESPMSGRTVPMSMTASWAAFRSRLTLAMVLFVVMVGRANARISEATDMEDATGVGCIDERKE